MSSFRVTKGTVAALFLLFFFAVVVPLRLECIYNCIKVNVVYGPFWVRLKEILDIVKNTFQMHDFQSVLNITIGAFSISTVLFALFLEFSNKEYRGYTRKQFCSPFCYILFASQFTYAALTAFFIFLNSDGELKFIYYSVIFNLILSFIMVIRILLLLFDRLLDIKLISNVKTDIFKYKNSIKKRRYNIPENKEGRLNNYKEKKYQKNLGVTFEILRKISFDAGHRFAVNRKQEFDYLFLKTIKILAAEALGSPELTEIKSGFHTFIYHMTQHLIFGYTKNKPSDSEKDNSYFVMLKKLFVSLSEELCVKKKQGENKSDRGKSRIQVFILSMMVCSVIDNTGSKEMSRFFMYISEYQYLSDCISEDVFNRVYFTLYARGFYLLENVYSADSANADSVFSKIIWNRLTYNPDVETDVRQLWQIWRDMDGLSLYKAAALLEKLISSFKEGPASRSRNLVSLLLYGKENIEWEK